VAIFTAGNFPSAPNHCASSFARALVIVRLPRGNNPSITGSMFSRSTDFGLEKARGVLSISEMSAQ
jgi:hypothetical protein